MTRTLRAFWWSPRHSKGALRSELRHHPIAWASLVSRGGRPLTNYGDELNHLILSEVTGRKVVWAPLGTEDVVAIGSILVPYFRNGGRGQIWGSGLGEPVIPADVVAPVRERFLAVRGPRTRSALGLRPELPLGDPGLLVRGIGRKPDVRRGKLLIPHFTVYNTAAGRRKIAELAATGFEIAPPTTEPKAMIARIQQADHVVSSGLHGVILSHALGTPVTLISFSEKAASGPGYKYIDYRDSVGCDLPLVKWTHLLQDHRDIRDAASETANAVTPRIDVLVEKLHASATAIA